MNPFTTLSYGLYVISSVKAGKLNGYIGNTVFQLTPEPEVIGLCANKENLTTEYIKSSKVVGVSVLSESADLKFIGRFGFRTGRDIEKFDGVGYKLANNGTGLLCENTVSTFEAEVIDEVDVGSHILFICRVTDSAIVDEITSPLTYKYYHEVIKGKTPKNASTYQK